MADALYIGSPADVIDLTLSTDTNVYADNEVLADTQELPLAVKQPGGIARLVSLVVLDEADQGAAFDLIVLDADVSIGTENGNVAITDTNARRIIGRVAIASGDYYDLVGSRIAVKNSIDQILKAASGSTSLYVAAISRGTGTYAASSIRLKFGFAPV